jgi:hypothetical protein
MDSGLPTLLGAGMTVGERTSTSAPFGLLRTIADTNALPPSASAMPICSV